MSKVLCRCAEMALKLQAVLSPKFSSKVTTRQQNTANAHVEFDVSWSGRLQGFDWMLLLLYSKPDCFKRKLRFKRRERMKQLDPIFLVAGRGKT